MSYKHISIPETGEMIVVNADNSISVPDNPIIPYIKVTVLASISRQS